ncbi:heptosyltransferase II [Candidatus Magnetomoraceae bacterium gMMP-1]
MKNIKKLLIRSTNWIGDAIMTTPAVRAIKKNFPGAEITMLAKPWVAPVFDNSPYVDHVIIYDDSGKHKGITGKFRLAKELKPCAFDAAILLQNAIEAAIITFLAKIPIRIGYNTDVRGLLLTHSIKCTPEIKKLHQTKYYLEILKGAGFITDGTMLDLFLSRKDQVRAKEILKSCGISDKDLIVGINPSATFGSAKQWFPERYARLADKIQQSYNAKIIIFGGPKDRMLGEKISEMMQHELINLCGKTSLEEAIALIEQCNLFITNDSGLMHIAAALDIPLIAIFGSTNPVTTGPWSDKSKIISISAQCSPCLKPECPLVHHKCMDEIKVDMVFKAVMEMM